MMSYGGNPPLNSLSNPLGSPLVSPLGNVPLADAYSSVEGTSAFPLSVGGFPSHLDTFNKMKHYSEAVASVIAGSSLNSAYSAYLNSVSEAKGLEEQNRLSLLSARSNTLLDLQQYSLRVNYGLMSKQFDMSILASQVREKLFNTFNDMDRGKLDNTFQRAKQIVQAFKY